MFNSMDSFENEKYGNLFWQALEIKRNENNDDERWFGKVEEENSRWKFT